MFDHHRRRWNLRAFSISLTVDPVASSFAPVLVIVVVIVAMIFIQVIELFLYCTTLVAIMRNGCQGN